MSIEIASVSIPSELNLSGFNSGLRELERTNVKPLQIDVKLNTASLERDRKALEATLAKPLLLTLEVDDTALMTLRRRLQRAEPYKVKVTTEIDTKGIAKARQQINKSIDAIPTIKIRVDDTALYSLNEHLDIKVSHAKRVNHWMAQNPIKVAVDTRELDRATNGIKQLKNNRLGSNSINTAPQQKDIRVDVNTQNIEKAIEKLQAPKQGLGSKIGESITAPFKAVGKTIDKVFTGALEGVGRPLGEDIGTGIKEGIQRETGDIVGSFKLVSREIGAEVSKGIVEALGQDAELIKETFEQVLGKQTITIEAAAQRQVSGQQRRLAQKQASQQIQKEFDFVRQNMPAIKERGQNLQQQRQKINEKQEKLQVKVAETAEALGVKFLQERLDSLQEQRSKIIDEMSSVEDVNAVTAYQSQLERLSESYKTTESSIERINKQAANRYKELADKLADANDSLMSEERAFGKLISPIESIDLIPKSKALKNKPKTKVSNVPAIYRNIAEQVGAASRTNIDAAKLPALVANQNMPKGSYGMYEPTSNEIQVPPQMLEAIKVGNLNAKQVETLVHELRHAVQFGFGKADVQAIRTGANNAQTELIRPLSEELKQFRRSIEGSVKEQAPEYQSVARQLEADAYAFAARNTPQIQAKVSKSMRVAQFEQNVGIGGAKAETVLKQSQLKSLQKLQAFKGLIPELGLDSGSVAKLEASFTETTKNIYSIDQALEDVLEKAANVELFDIDQINAMEQEILAQVAELNQLANRYTQDFAEQLQQAKANQSKPLSQQLPESAGLSFGESLNKNYTSKGLREVAGKLNLGGLGSASKESLVKAISVAREHDQKQVEKVLSMLGDSIKKKTASTGTARTLPKLEGFSDIKATLQQTDAEVKQAMAMLTDAQEDERKEILQAVVEELENQIAWIDELTTTYDVSGKEKQSLTGYRNLFDSAKASPNAELMNIRNKDIQKLSGRSSVKGGNAQGVSSMRGNSFDALHSVSDIQSEINALFSRAQGGSTDKGSQAYHSVADVQEAIQSLMDEIALRLRPNAATSLNQADIESDLNIPTVNTPLALPDDAEAAQVVANLRNTLDEYEQLENQINQNLQESSEEVNASIASIGENNETVVSRIKRIYRAFQEEGATGGIQSFKDNLGGLFKAFLGFRAISTITNLIKDFAPALIESAMAMESLERRFGFVSGSFSEGAKNLAYVRSEVKRLGTDVKASMEGFTSLAGATRDTSLEGEATKQIFSGVSQASTVYDLNAEQQKRVFTAVQQMASKGKVSSEELRQQLGESLPGAFQIAARSMGVTTSQLNKMLEQGQVLSEDFLPKFAQQLSSETASGVAGAANSSVSALIGFNNTVFETQAALGKELLPARNMGLQALSAGLGFVKENADILMSAIQFLSLYMSVNAVGSILKFVGGLKILGGQALFSVGGLQALGGAAKGALVSAAPMLAAFVAFKIVGEIFENLSFSFSDAGGSIRNFADTSKKGLGDFTKALKEARGEQEALTNGLTKGQLTKQSRDKDRDNSFLWNITGSNFIRNNITKPLLNPREVLGKKADESVSIGDRFKAIGKRFGDIGKPKAIKELDDKVVATREAVAASNTRIGLSQGAEVQGIIKDVQGIDKQLRAVQVKRRGVITTNPKDVETIKQLKQEEETLLKNREKLYKPVGVMQSQYQADVDGLKAALEEYEQLRKTGNIDDKTYAEETSVLKTQLDKAEKAQRDFTKAIGENINAVSLLAKQFKDIADRVADASSAAQMSANAQKASLYGNTNLTQEQRAFSAEQIDTGVIEAQAKESLQAVQEQVALLMTPENLATLQAYGANENTGAAQLKTLAERAGDDSPDSKLFDQMAALKEQQLQTSDLQAQVAQRKAETQQKLRDLNKQVEEYYRGIARQAAESEIQLAKQMSELDNQQNANRINAAMLGAGDNIISQFVGSLLDAVNQIAQAADGSFDAQSQILQAQNAFEDTFRGGEELRRQLPAMQVAGDLPSVSIDLDINAASFNEDIQSVNDAINTGVTATQSLTDATGDFNASIAASGNLIEDNTASTIQLESGISSVNDTVQGGLELYGNIEANLKDVNNEIGNSASLTANVNDSVDAGLYLYGNVEASLRANNDAIDSNVSSQDLLNTTVDITTDSASYLQSQIDSNTMAIDANDMSMQSVGGSIDANTQKTALTTEQSQKWWAELGTVEKISVSVQAVFGAIGESIMGAIAKTVDWFKTFANNIPILNQVGQTLSGFGNAVGGAIEGGKEMLGLGGGAVSGAAQKVIDAAKNWVGKDFAPGLSEQCANFVRNVLKEAGLADKIGVTSKAIDGLETGPALASSFFGSDIGKIIKNKDEARAGDLVAFMGTYGGYGKDTITHVGVYAGNDMIYDRSTSSKPVKHRSLDTFGKGNYVFVRPHAYGDSAAPANAGVGGSIGGSAQKMMASMGGGGLQLPSMTVSGSSGASGKGHIAVTGGRDYRKLSKEENIQSIVSEAVKAGVKDKAQIAYIVATAMHETGGFKFFQEQGSRGYFDKYEGASDLGNTQAGDGYKFRGHGFTQLTGRRNFEVQSKRMGVDLIKNPELLADPSVSANVLVSGILKGEFTGAKLSDYIGNGKADISNARRTINGYDQAQVNQVNAEYSKILPSIDKYIANAGKGGVAIAQASSSGGFTPGASMQVWQPESLARVGNSRIDMAQDSAKAQRDAQQAAAARQAAIQAETGTIGALQKASQSLVQVQKQLRQSGYETRDLFEDVNKMNLEGMGPLSSADKRKQAINELTRQYRDSREKVNEKILDVQNRQTSARAILEQPGGVLTPATKEKFNKLLSMPIADDLKTRLQEAMTTGVFGDQLRNVLQKSVAQGNQEIATLQKAAQALESGEKGALKAAQERFDFEEKARANAAKFEQESLSIATLQARLEQLKAKADRDPFGGAKEQIPAMEALVALRQNTLDYDKQIDELEKKKRDNTVNQKEADGQIKELKNKKAVTEQTIKENQAYQEIVNSREKANRDREIGLQAAKDELAVQKQQLETLKALPTTDAQRNQIPQLEYQVSLSELQLKLQEDIAAVNEAVFKDPSSKTAGDARIAKLNQEFELAQKNLEVRLKQSSVEQELAQKRALIGIREQELGYAEQLLEAQSRSIELGRMAGDTLGARYELQSQQQMLGFEKSILDVKELALQSGKSTEEIAGIEAKLRTINDIKLDNIGAEMRKAFDDRAVAVNQRMGESNNSVLGARQSLMSTYGFTQEASRIGKEIAVNQQGMDFTSQKRDLEEFIKTNAVAADKAALLRANLESVNDIKFREIEAQFNPLKGVIDSSVGALKGAFKSLIKDGKIDFDSFFDGILDSIADFLSNMLVEQLMGFLSPNKDKKKGGGIFPDATADPKAKEGDFTSLLGLGNDPLGDLNKMGTTPVSPMYVNVVNANDLAIAKGANNIVPFSRSDAGSGFSFGGLGGGSIFGKQPDYVSATSNIFGDLGGLFSPGLPPVSMTNPFPVNVQQAKPNIFSSIMGAVGGGGGIGGAIGGIASAIGGGGGFGGIISAVLPMLTGFLGFASGGVIGSGRGEKDDQLILAQRGEGVLSHKGMATIGGAMALNAINRGMYRVPKFASGGVVTGEYGRYGADAVATASAEREAARGNATIKVETQMINGIEYATVEQVRQAAMQARNEGARDGATYISNKMENSTTWRNRHGLR